jgi:phosphoglycolate phosphatase-like HAD superfamily hydrolase
MIYTDVFFDFDGVLVESLEVKEQALAGLYAPWGEAVMATVLAHHRANGGMSRYEKFRLHHPTLLGLPIDEAEVAEMDRRMSTQVEAAVIAVAQVPGAVALLERLQPLCRLHVVSATPEPELHRVVQGRGWWPYFTTVNGSPQKKTPMVADLCARFAVDPGKAVMLGDAKQDIQAAQANGLAFIGRVPHGEPSPFPADTPLVADMHEAATLLFGA